MDFFSVILFVVLYHLRPHEWIGAVAFLRPAMIAMLLGLFGTITREKGFSLGLLFKTPHDWLMAAYLFWMVGTSPDPKGTWLATYSLFLYYFVIVLALSNVERMRKFVSWWAIMLLVVAAFAVGSEFGFDPMHSEDITHGKMKGRLILNLSIFDNPNALGHSLVPLFGIFYFLYIWKRFFAVKITALPPILLGGWCLYLTLSKGAYLSAFGTALVGYSFRKPVGVKILLVIVSATIGWAALKTLPRMQELDRPSAEGGIQGRVWVFRWGLHTLHNTWKGVGWGQFAQAFSRSSGFQKAPHSTYVAVGAELGWPGLTIFLGIIYCCFKTLTLAVTDDDEEERIRRALFVLIFSFCVSSWMVGWANRASFFMMVAAIAAFHRHMLGLNGTRAELPQPVEETQTRGEIQPELAPRYEPVMAGWQMAPQYSPVATLDYAGEVIPAPNPTSTSVVKMKWNSFNWVDGVMIFIVYHVVVRIWTYAVSTM